MTFTRIQHKHSNTRISRSSRNTHTKKYIENECIQKDYSVYWKPFVFFGSYLLVLVGISYLLVFFLFWLQKKTYFSLQHIEVNGLTRLSTQNIISLAGVERGENLLRVRIGSIYERLQKSPWVKDVSVRRVLPDSLYIDVAEVQASFWIQHKDALYYADSLGFPITPVENTFFVSFPVLEIEKGAEDFIIHLPAFVQELKKNKYPFDSKSIAWVKLCTIGTLEIFVEPLGITISIALQDWRLNIQKVHLVIKDLIKKGNIKNVKRIQANSAVLVDAS